MQSYHFGQDILDTYQSMPFALQMLWLVVPPTFIAGVLALVLFYRLATKRQGYAEGILHPFAMDDKDIDHIMAYAPPKPDAPVLLAVTRKKKPLPPRQFKTTLTPSEMKAREQSAGS